MCWGFFSPHQAIFWFSNTSWMSYDCTQFWHCLTGDSIQSHSLKAQTLRLPPLQIPASSPGRHPCLWLSGCKSKVPMTPSLGLIICKNSSQNSGKQFTYNLVRLPVYYKEVFSKAARWKRCTGQSMWAGLRAPLPSPGTFASLPTWKLAKSPSLDLDEASLYWASLVARMVKNLPPMQESQVQSLHWEDPLKEGMATHSSILAWRIPWTEEPVELQSMRSQRVEHDWAILIDYITGCSWLIQLQLFSPPRRLGLELKCQPSNYMVGFPGNLPPSCSYLGGFQKDLVKINSDVAERCLL